MVPLQMELGGKDVCIVCEDANLDLAAKHIVKGGFSYSGQRCTAVKLVLVLDKVWLLYCSHTALSSVQGAGSGMNEEG
jgi:acyl-CoA reductase-like NAD-dependent aldehyde dehydrogenase